MMNWFHLRAVSDDGNALVIVVAVRLGYFLDAILR
jgi:hypothetical protein